MVGNPSAGQLTGQDPTVPSASVPSSLRYKYSNWEWTIAWQHVPELVTYRLLGPADRVHFLKLAPAGRYPTLAGEARRLAWAKDFVPVPAVLDSGSDGEVEWLVTNELPGLDGSHPSFRSDPDALVRMLAEGLRRLHDLPVPKCPFDFRLEVALDWVRKRLEGDAIDPANDFHDEHRELGAKDAVALVHETRPGAEDLVVCHGDFCPPNVLIDQGSVVAYLDLGELGVADRWWDLAVATWSVTWNLGEGHERAFLAAYGVEPDPERMAFYRLLYDLVS